MPLIVHTPSTWKTVIIENIFAVFFATKQDGYARLRYGVTAENFKSGLAHHRTDYRRPTELRCQQL